jgi:cytidylate kinase
MNNVTISEQEILESINKRDEFDSSREIAPLKCPEDATIIDTSNLTIDK